MEHNIYTVDAFAEKPFTGNPAAVCLLSSPKEEDWMQNIAREMNLSETAFLNPIDGGFSLRWFTPTVEVSLCGHATLASAHILWETGLLNPAIPARFHTKSGLLIATQRSHSIELDFPAKPVTFIKPPGLLVESLRTDSKFVGKNDLDFLLEVESEKCVRELQPDMPSLRTLPVRGIIVTARSSNPEYDFVSRFFAPAAGVDEDPVTGSAHCALGPYWQGVLGRSKFTAFQASARGGVVGVRMADERVFLTGRAITVMNGKIIV